MSKLLEKYQINIWMCGYSQIQGTKSKKDEELREKSVPYFQQESGPCPLDWRITIHSNVDRVFFQQSWHIWLCWKITRTTFQCTVVLQSRGKDFLLVKILWKQDLRVEHIAIEKGKSISFEILLSVCLSVFSMVGGRGGDEWTKKRGGLFMNIFFPCQRNWHYSPFFNANKTQITSRASSPISHEGINQRALTMQSKYNWSCYFWRSGLSNKKK